MAERTDWFHFNADSAIIAGKSDVGKKRAANEDSIGWCGQTRNGLALYVCDGMGGHIGGAHASQTAVDAIKCFFEQDYYENPKLAVKLAIEFANEQILKEAERHPELRGMGSTCVLLLIRDGLVYVGHVGDSRIYLIRPGFGQSIQLTKDQSYVQTLVDSGALTVIEAEHHPRSNEITNALGLETMTPPIVRPEGISPEAGDCFVLCSDGLSKLVSLDEITSIVNKKDENGNRLPVGERCLALVDAANQMGGVDNISVVLAEFPAKPRSIALEKARKKKVTKTILLGVVSALFIALAAFVGANISHWLQKDEGIKAPDVKTEVKPDQSSDQASEATVSSDLLQYVNSVSDGKNADDKKTSPKADSQGQKEQKADSKKDVKSEQPSDKVVDTEAKPDVQREANKVTSPKSEEDVIDNKPVSTKAKPDDGHTIVWDHTKYSVLIFPTKDVVMTPGTMFTNSDVTIKSSIVSVAVANDDGKPSGDQSGPKLRFWLKQGSMFASPFDIIVNVGGTKWTIHVI